QLDVLVVTHPDFDHYSGLPTTLAGHCPAELWWTGQGDQDPRWQELMQVLDRCQTRRRRFDLSQHQVEIDGVQLEVLHPLVDASSSLRHWPELDRNDNSLVVLVRHGEVRALLTGDASTLVEDSLRDRGVLERIHLLKAAHHGSAHSTSSAFLDVIQPLHTVISAGHANRFGHPAPAVLSRLARAHSQVWRTDQQGLIEATSNGHELKVSSFQPAPATPPDRSTQVPAPPR
ncbi:MAG: MBL fold metallo-hydrolase, partial [Pseudomonadota bacterium]